MSSDEHYVKSQYVGVPEVFAGCLEVEMQTVYGDVGTVGADAVGPRRRVVVHSAKLLELRKIISSSYVVIILW